MYVARQLHIWYPNLAGCDARMYCCSLPSARYLFDSTGVNCTQGRERTPPAILLYYSSTTDYIDYSTTAVVGTSDSACEQNTHHGVRGDRASRDVVNASAQMLLAVCTYIHSTTTHEESTTIEATLSTHTVQNIHPPIVIFWALVLITPSSPFVDRLSFPLASTSTNSLSLHNLHVTWAQQESERTNGEQRENPGLLIYV